MVLRPILLQGPWLETFVTDFARQGLALCAGGVSLVSIQFSFCLVTAYHLDALFLST